MWSDRELTAIIRAYVEMLQFEARGEPYVKAEQNRSVQAVTGRSKGSIEFKFCNISAVLRDRGYRWVPGYAPRSNYQRALADATMQLLGTDFPNAPRPEVPRAWDTELGVPETRHGVDPQDEHPEGATVAVSDDIEWWTAIGGLWEKATGGADVAAAPGMASAIWPTVSPAPGVAEACRWMRESSGSVARFVFLVGGPGAGKSQALASLVADLPEVEPTDSGLAERSYRFEMPDRELAVINDATISADHLDDAALASDIERAIASGTHLFACVNRGILVEEASAIGRPDSAGQTVVSWLASGELDRVEGRYEIMPMARTEFLSSATLTIDGSHLADVLVVFVDLCSLFERRPHATITDTEGGVSVKGDAYAVQRLVERDHLDEATIPAGALVRHVTDLLRGPSQVLPSWNPIAANVQSLESARVRSGLLTVLRASEIVTGSRMTFREVWGAVARCLVGDMPSTVQPSDLRTRMEDMAPATKDAVKTFHSMRELASYRFSQAIFGGDRPSPTNPVTRMTSRVDPTRDAIPGQLDRGRADSGWSHPVLEAFSGLVTAASPLETILREIPAQDVFSEVVTPFDRALDESFVAVTGPGGLADRKREEAIAWYGDYLLRLYALANGVPAFRHEVALWTQVWVLGENLPHALESSLKTLLRPRRDPNDPDSSLLLPVFESRTTPITGSLTQPKLAVRGQDVSVKAIRRGDSLSLHMIENAEFVGSMELDFSIIRAAQSCAHGHVGITEVSSNANPRLERFRAQRLIPDRLSTSYCLLDNGREMVVNLEATP